MSLKQLTTIDAVRQFLEGTQTVAFSVATCRQERYRWVQKTLVKHRYLLLGKTDKGIVTRYLMKVTGCSLAQTERPRIRAEFTLPDSSLEWRILRTAWCCEPQEK